MESLGIMLSFPMSFIFSFLATSAYSHVLKRIVSRWNQISKWILWPSYVILTLLIIEIICVITIGSLDITKIVGFNYYRAVNLTIFCLAVPSLANLIQLQAKFSSLAKWYITALICACVGVGLVVLQYVIAEPFIKGDF
jgi:hypothetical protein